MMFPGPATDTGDAACNSRCIPPAEYFAMRVCPQCQGAFASDNAFADHLLMHMRLTVFESEQQHLRAPSLPVPPPPISNPPLPPQPPPLPKEPSVSDGGWMIGTVTAYKASGGFGFIKCDNGPREDVFFHISACTVQTPAPSPGESVRYTAVHGPKGLTAVSVDRVRPDLTKPDLGTELSGVVTAYQVLGGFGTIMVGSPSMAPEELGFKVIHCDIKRPPPAIGERVMVTRGDGPKGPFAESVRRDTISVEGQLLHAKKAKPTKPQSKKVAVESDVMAALGPGMSATVNFSTRPAAAQVHAKPAPLPVSVPATSTHERPKARHYRDMLASLEQSDLYVASATVLLNRTQPQIASVIRSVDPKMQLEMFVAQLQRELQLAEHAEGGATATSVLDFGGCASPRSPVARPSSSKPSPAPLPATTRRNPLRR